MIKKTRLLYKNHEHYEESEDEGTKKTRIYTIRHNINLFFKIKESKNTLFRVILLYSNNSRIFFTLFTQFQFYLSPTISLSIEELEG